jgi:ribosomal protein S27E
MDKRSFKNITGPLRKKIEEIRHFLMSGQIEFKCPRCEQDNYQSYNDWMDRVYCDHCGTSLVFGRDLCRIPVY